MKSPAYPEISALPTAPAQGWLSGRARWRERLPEIAVLALGLVASLAFDWGVRQWEGERRLAAFHEDVEVYSQAIGARLSGLVADVQAIAQFYTASQEVGADEFALFARPSLERNRTVRALEWAPRVRESERAAFESRVRAAGPADFAIRELAGGELRPAAARPEYFPVYRMEPLSGNARALGFDLASEPSRRAALEQARDTGLPVATVPLTLVQESAGQRGMVIFVPQAREGRLGDTPAQRRARLAGFAVGVVRLGELVEGALAALPSGHVDLLLRDADLPGEAGLLYVHPSRSRLRSGAALDPEAFARDPRTFVSRLVLAGRTIELRALPAPGAYPDVIWPESLLGLGLAVSAALAALVWHRRRAQAQLRERDALFRLFVDNSPAIAWIKDERNRYVYLSTTYEQTFGVRLADWQGKTDFDVWPEDLAARFYADDQAALAADRPLEVVESTPESGGGRRYWQTVKRSFCDAAGRRYVGGIGIEVTARRHAEDALREGEVRYRSLFEHMPIGYAYCQMLYEDGLPRDFLYLSVNPAFRRLTGLESVVGRPVSEVIPGICESNPELFEIYGRVAASGTPEQLEIYLAPLGIWLAITVYSAVRGRFVALFDNITPRKQAELDLRRYRQIVETSGEMLLFIDPDLRLRLVNPAYAALRHASPEDLRGRLVSEVAGAENYAAIGPHLESALAGRPQRFSSRVIGADGMPRFLESAHNPFFGDDGAVLGVVVSIHDVTEAQEAHAALEDQQARLAELVAARTAELQVSESKLRTIYELLPIGIAITDPAGLIVDCNPATEALLGISRDAQFRRTCEGPQWAAIRPDGTPMPCAEYADVRALAERRTVRDVEMGIARRDGVVWLSVSAMPSAHPEYGVVIAFVDITERHRAQVELEASEEKARAVIDASPVPLAIGFDAPSSLQAGGGLTQGLPYVNPAFVDTFGYTPEDAPTLEEWWPLAYPDPDYRREVARIWAQRLERLEREGGPFEPMEVMIRCKDGTARTVMATATSLGQSFGGLHLATLYDVTELRQARELALQATRMKSEFLANISHEIRTPMNAVLGLAQLLERETLAEDQRRMVQRIRAAGRSLLGLIDDILDFSKIEAGALRLETRPFAPAAVLAQVHGLMGQMAAAKGLLLRIDAPDGLADRLLGDPLRLEQILLNLVGNAVKFTDRGEVQVRVRQTDLPDNAVLLQVEVTDTGIGIAPEHLKAMFAPFTQADTTIARRFGGTGLGLAISKQLVELMGGTLGVESRVGVGSVFRFEVPFAREPGDAASAGATALAPPQAATRGAPRLCGLRCLVVDDSPMNLEVVERMLVREGARATLAGNGRGALDLLRASPDGYDAVLLDIQMPEMDGLSATRAIRGELGLAALPVIALSAGVLAGQRQQALDAGLNDFLQKPVDLDELVAALHRRVPSAACGAAPVAEGPAAFPEIPGLDTARAALLLDNDLNLFLERLRRFAAELGGTASELRADLARGEPRAAARRLHLLRGNAGYLGALGLTRAAAALERSILAERADLDDLLDDFERQLDALVLAILPWLGPPAATSGAAGAAGEPDPARLAALRVALAGNDMAALDLFEALAPTLTATLGSPASEALGEAIHALRFDRALSLLEGGGAAPRTGNG